MSLRLGRTLPAAHSRFMTGAAMQGKMPRFIYSFTFTYKCFFLILFCVLIALLLHLNKGRGTFSACIDHIIWGCCLSCHCNTLFEFTQFFDGVQIFFFTDTQETTHKEQNKGEYTVIMMRLMRAGFNQTHPRGDNVLVSQRLKMISWQKL